MSKEELCPFCGGEPYECLDNHFGCLNLGCAMAGARAIPLEDWNSRPIEDALRARIAELQKEILKAGLQHAYWIKELHTCQDCIVELEAEVTKGHELQDSYCDRIVELKGFIGQLIEVGDRAIAFNEVDRFIDKWNAPVKDLKEREE
jgi:hypothetical protein